MSLVLLVNVSAQINLVTYSDGEDKTTVESSLGFTSVELNVATGSAIHSGKLQGNDASAIWNKRGSGTLEISRLDVGGVAGITYSGSTVVSEGILNISGEALTPSVTVEDGAGLQLEWNSLLDTSTLTLNGTGSLTLNASTDIGSITSSSSSSTINLGSSTLITGDASNTTFAGIISGTGAFEKKGTGTLTLSGANTYTGSTTVNGGIVDVTGSLSSSAIYVNSGTGLTVDGSSILDTAEVHLNNSGNLTLTGNETLGRLVGATSGSTISLGANTLKIAGDGIISDISSVISGTGGLTKDGTGSLILRGANTYTGTTTLNSGTVALYNGQAIADVAALELNGASLQILNSETVGAFSGTGGSLTLYNGVSFTTGGNGGPTTYAGRITATGSNNTFTKAGSDTLTLSGQITGGSLLNLNVDSGTLALSHNNNYFNAVNVNGGTLRLEADGAAGGSSGQINTTGSVIDYADGVNINTAININSDTTQVQVSTGSATQSGVISETNGPRGLEKIGDGTLLLTAANTYTGTTTVSGGILEVSGSIASESLVINSGAQFTSSAYSISNTAAVTLNGTGILNLPNGEQIGSLSSSSADSRVNLSGTYRLIVGDSNDTEFAGVINGNNGFTKLGAGTLTLSGHNTFTGQTLLNQGTLNVTGSLASNSIFLSGANPGNTLILGESSVPTDTFISLSGTSRLVLSGNNSIRAIFQFPTATIDLGSHTLTFNGATSSSSILGSVTGSGGLIINSEVGLYESNAYTGDTIINSGFLGVAGGQAISDTGSVILNGGRFLIGESETIGSLSGTGGEIEIFIGDILTTNGTGTNTFTGNIIGEGTFTKGGSDTLTLSGKLSSELAALNVNSGTLVLSNNSNEIRSIFVNGGTLRLEADGAAGGSGGLITTRGSTIDYASSIDVATSILLDSDTTTLQVLDGSATQSGVISETNGSRPLEKTGDGTLVLTAQNTFTGKMTVTQGTLAVNGSGTLASSSIETKSGTEFTTDGGALDSSAAITNAGIVDLNGSESIASINGSGSISIDDGSLTLNSGNSLIGNPISGSGGLIIQGSSETTLSASNTYTGETVVDSGGQLTLETTASLASESTVNSGGIFTNNGKAGEVINSGNTTNTGTIVSFTQTAGTLDNSGTISGELSITGGSVTNQSQGVVTGATIITDPAEFSNSGTVGDVGNSGTFTNSGSASTVNNSGTTTNSGTVFSVTQTAGTLDNSGTISGELSIAGGSVTNQSQGVVTGAITITDLGEFSNSGTVGDVSNSGTFTNSGSVSSVNNFGTATNFGTVFSVTQTAGTFDNNGTIFGDASILGGTLNNNVGASIFGTITIGSAGIFNNFGSIAAIDNMGSFTSSGSIGAVTNSGTFTNSGTIASLIQSSGIFNNNGTISGDLMINGGTFNNFSSSNILGITSVSSNGMLFNAGQIGEVFNAGNFTNTGTTGSVFNSGIGSNTGTIASFTQTEGSFSNSGSITGDLGIVAGTVTNQLGGTVGGLTTITSASSLDNAGTLANVNNTGIFNNSGTAGSVYSTGVFTNTGTVVEVTYAGPAADALFAPQSLLITSTSQSEIVSQKLLNSGTVHGNLFLSTGTAEITANGSVEGVTVVESGARLSNAGKLGETQNKGTLSSTGTLGNVFNTGMVVNFGDMSSLVNTAGNFAHNSGTISGNLIVTGGVVDIFGGSIEGATQNGGGTLTIAGGNFSGDVTNIEGSTTLNGTIQGNFLNNDLMIVVDSGALSLDGGITNYTGATLELAGTTASIFAGLTNFGITNAANATLQADVTNSGQFDLTAGTVNGTFNNSGILMLEDGTISGSLTNSAMVKAHGKTSIGGLVSSGSGFITMAGNGTGDVLTIDGAIPNGGVFETDLDLNRGTSDFIDAGHSNISGSLQFVFDVEGTGFIGDPINILASGSSGFTLLYSNLPIGGLIDYTLQPSSSGGIDLISQTNMGIGGIATSTSLIQSHVSTVVNRPLSDFLRYQNAKDVVFQSGFARSTYGSATINSLFNNGVSDQQTSVDLSYTGVQGGWDMVYNDARFFNGWNGSIGAMIGHTNGKSDQLIFGTMGNGEFHQASITNTDFEQNYFTVYGSLNKNRWMWDAQVRMESTEFTLNEEINFGSGLGLDDTKLDNQTLSLSNRISYLWQFAKNYELQPSVGISYAKTSAGDVRFPDAQSLQVESFISTLAFAGGVLSRNFTNQSQNRTFTLFAEGNYFKDFTSERSSFFTDMSGGNHAITTGKMEGFGELGIGVSFFSSRRDKNARIKSINGVLRADAQFGNQLEEAINFSGQFRLTF